MLHKIRSTLGLLRRLPVQSYYTLSGWRFADLKEHIDRSNVKNDDALLAFIEVTSAISAGAGPRAKTALVTCLPPDESGIANFSLKHILAARAELDVFSPVRDVAQFLRNSALINKGTGGLARLHPLSSLLALNEMQSYETLVFVIGNSNHNVDAYRAMESVARLQGADRSICYLHDPCCHNVVQVAKRLNGDEYVKYLTQVYGTRLPGGMGLEGWRVHRTAVERGIMGVRAILDAGAGRFLVNSKTAADLVLNDLPAERRERVKVEQLFHPTFPLEPGIAEALEQKQPGGPFVVGTFGGADHSKRSEVVVEAVKNMRDRGEPVELRIAGYRARNFVDLFFGGNVPDWVHASEPPTERELQTEMAKCDIAIQLRKESLGESSGVVPTLLGMGIPTVVSPIGAFREYGDAVLYFEGGVSDLTTLLEKRPSVPASVMQEYAEKHSLSAFEEAFRLSVSKVLAE